MAVRAAWKWVWRAVGAMFLLLAGLFGSGGEVIADRREMYGDDPRNDPYSPEFDPDHGRRR